MTRRGQRLEGGVIFGVDSEDEREINSIFKEALKDKKLNEYEIIVGKGIKDQFMLENGFEHREAVNNIFSRPYFSNLLDNSS